MELQYAAAGELLRSVKWDLNEANKLLTEARKRRDGKPNKLVRRLIRRAGGYDAAAEMMREVWGAALSSGRNEARLLLSWVESDAKKAVSLVRDVATKPIVCDRALETFLSPQDGESGDRQRELDSCGGDLEKVKLSIKAAEKYRNQQHSAYWLLKQAGSVDVAIAAILDVAAKPKPAHKPYYDPVNWDVDE